MTRFTDIDLTGLTPPPVVEPLDFEVLLDAWVQDLITRFSELGVVYDVGALETDPAKIVMEAGSFRETIVRSRINTAARAILLAYAQKGDLDQLAAYYGVQRLLVTPETEETPAVFETDESLRRRVQLAPEALAAAGPEGAYQFHAFTVDPSIKDVAVLNPAPGQVHVLPLVDAGNGEPSADLLERVRARLMQKDIKPLTDMLTVRSPTIVPYAVTASLEIAEGPDPDVVLEEALAKVEAYAISRHLIGLPVRRSGLFAALHVAGVEHVTLSSPAEDVVPDDDEAAFAEAISVTIAS